MKETKTDRELLDEWIDAVAERGLWYKYSVVNRVYKPGSSWTAPMPDPPRQVEEELEDQLEILEQSANEITWRTACDWWHGVPNTEHSLDAVEPTKDRWGSRLAPSEDSPEPYFEPRGSHLIAYHDTRESPEECYLEDWDSDLHPDLPETFERLARRFPDLIDQVVLDDASLDDADQYTFWTSTLAPDDPRWLELLAEVLPEDDDEDA